MVYVCVYVGDEMPKCIMYMFGNKNLCLSANPCVERNRITKEIRKEFSSFGWKILSGKCITPLDSLEHGKGSFTLEYQMRHSLSYFKCNQATSN